MSHYYNYDGIPNHVCCGWEESSRHFAAAIQASYDRLNERIRLRELEITNEICKHLSLYSAQRTARQQRRIMATFQQDGAKPYDVATLRAAPVRPSDDVWSVTDGQVEYHILDAGEVIQVGDEFKYGSEAWRPCYLSINKQLTQGAEGFFRRPLPTRESPITTEDGGSVACSGFIPGESSGWNLNFRSAILFSYDQLNKRLANEYETQLVPLSSPPKYRMLELGEVIQKGDELRYNSGEGWRPCVGSVGADIDPEDLGDFRRPIPAPKYRAVRPGERIKEGDEWRLSEEDSWKPVRATVGDPLVETSVGNFRRPI